MKDLFANYSKEVRPVIDKEEPIPVNFDMMFSQLVELVCTQASTFFWTWGASLSKPSASLRPKWIFCDTLSPIPYFRPDILKFIPY